MITVTLDAVGVTSIWQPAATGPADHALLVVLHGRGDSSHGFTWLRSALGIPGLSLLLLDAPDPYGPGLSWYDLPPDQLPGILRSRALLERVFAELERQGFPPERCLLFGFSQGCLMTLEFAGRSERRFAGCVGVSGYVFDPGALIAELTPAARSGAWLVTHGDHDDVLPIGRTRAQVRALIEAGLPVDWREYRKDHTIAPGELAELRAWIAARVREVGLDRGRDGSDVRRPRR